MIILDTDCLSLMNRDQILIASKLQKALDEIDAEQIYTSIISFEEQMRGWLSFIAKCKTANDQIFAYSRLHTSLESYRNTQVLDYDEKAAAVFDQLKSQKIRVGTMDLKIASIAIANDAILVSRNLVDFERVPNLQVYDWTQREQSSTSVPKAVPAAVKSLQPGRRKKFPA